MLWDFSFYNKERMFKLNNLMRKLLAVVLTLSMLAALVLSSAAKTNSDGVTLIMGPTTASVSAAKKWAKNKGATDEFVSLADIYWRQATAIGMNPVVAYCQSAVETGYGKFGGVIDASFHNPCGLKITDTSGFEDSDREPDAHQRFPDWETGISAHIDHLALYAGADGYPKSNTADPRHFSYLFNRCGNQVENKNGINGLSGWASGGGYPEKIVALVEELEALDPDYDGDNEVKPYIENGELWLNDCNSLNGFGAVGSTELFVENDSRGLTSMCMRNPGGCKGDSAGVGAMAFYDYSGGNYADVTPYNKIRFSMWCGIDYASSNRQEDYFQVNFVTQVEGYEQDGYNLNIPASKLRQGWNNDFVFDISDIGKAVDTADWSKITRMRYTWFNISQGDSVEFNIDNFVAYYEEPTDPVNPIDTTKTFTISDCDSLDSWKIYTGDTLNLDTAKKTQGSASLAAQQTGGLGLYYKFPGTTDFSNVNYITFDFIPAAADMAAVADVRLMLSSRDFINEDNTNSNSWNDQFCDLDVSGFKTMTLKANEWNHVTIPMAGRTATEGFDITKVKKLGIQLLSYYTDERPAGTVNYEWVDNVVAVVGEETPAETTVLCTCERDTEDVFDFCGNSHSVVDGALKVNSESTTASFPGKDGLYNMFYCRVGRNYGDSDYTRSFNYYKYAHVEMLVKPENNNTLIVTHGNEQNNMEWQYLSEVGVTGGRWQRVVMPISSIGTAVQGETSFGLNDVNLMHIAQTGAGSLLVKNIALVTEQYAAARSSAEQAYINAVNAIGTVTGGSKAAIDAAYAKKAEALKYINVQTEEFNTASAALDAAQAAYEALGDATAGDLDGDMRITANDALIVLQHSVGKRTLTDVQKKVSDVNKDGKVNAVDALMILQASVGRRVL